MPTVPQYQEGQVQDRALPNAQISEAVPQGAFGGGAASDQVNQALQGVLKTGQDFITTEKQKADKTAVLAADTQASAVMTDAMWNPDKGLYTKKGKDALGAAQAYTDDVDKSTAQIADSLTNDDQKLAFSEQLRRRKESFNEQVEKHVFTEMEKYKDSVNESAIAVSQNNAAQNFTDPNIIDQEIAHQTQTINEYGKDKGLPKDKIAELVTKNVSATHSLVVNRLLANGMDLKARQYYDENKEDVSGEDAVHLDKAVKEGSIRGESQRISDKIMAANPSSMSDALAETKKISNPEIRDAAETRVRADFAEKKKAEAQAREDSYMKIQQAIETNGGNLDAPNVIPLLGGLSSAEHSALEERSFQIRSGRKVVNNDAVYYNLMTQASTPELKDKFLSTNLLPYKSQLSNEKFDEILKLQAAARKGDDKEENRLSMGFLTQKDAVDGVLQGAGFPKTPKPGKESQDEIEFRTAVNNEVVKLQESTGKKATPEEVAGIASRLVAKGVTQQGWLWDTKKRVFQTKPDETIAVKLSDISSKDVSAISESLRKRNIPVTEATITDQYNRFINRNKTPGAVK